MDPEPEQVPPAVEPPIQSAPDNLPLDVPPQDPEEPYRGLKWVFIGPDGLRAGWSIPIFLSLFMLFANGLAMLLIKLHVMTRGSGFTPRQAFIGELLQVVALVAAAAIMALIERRSIMDYNLRGAHRVRHFFVGMVVGFAALSALVGSMAWGGWLHFGPVALGGTQILRYAAVWGVVFLLVGCVEEGSVRCYLQFTFARGLNFWWAVGIIAVICAFLAIKIKGNGALGVYVMALLGLAPCLLLELNKAPSSGFWQAAWVTSTLFGFAHTGNKGENWIGIFAAAAIGFVFCVSIWLTGSAWWAIGAHAAWDWAETYFYGTADSGFVAPGHLFSTSPAGNPLWSGGTDGPEGSLLVLPIVLLLLVVLLVIYRRPKPAELPPPIHAEQMAS